MILQALNSILSPIIDSHALIGDIEADLPFCVFRADAQPALEKAGICGFTYIVDIGVIDNEIETVNNYSDQITAAVLAMNGSISGTDVYKAIQTDESGVYWENDNNVYMNDLQFKVFTKNR